MLLLASRDRERNGYSEKVSEMVERKHRTAFLDNVKNEKVHILEQKYRVLGQKSIFFHKRAVFTNFSSMRRILLSAKLILLPKEEGRNFPFSALSKSIWHFSVN